MIDFGKILSVFGAAFGMSLTAFASLGLASPAVSVAPAKPANRLDQVFKSLQESTQGQPVDISWTPLLIAVLAAGMGWFAVKHWKRHRAKPAVKTLNNHRKLIRDAARAAGLSQRQLKTISPLAQSQGLSSPLVAIICPSALKKLAQNVQTSEQQDALKAMARGLIRHESASAKAGSAATSAAG
jgi:hypothetical protein